MIRWLAVLLLLAGCDSCLPESWRAVPKVGFERMAAERLKACCRSIAGQPSMVPQCGTLTQP
jgi:hypothetical protein